MKKIYSIAAALTIIIATATPVLSQDNSATNPITGFGVINFKNLADKELLNPPKLVKQRNNEEKEESQKGIPVNLPVPVGTKVFNVMGNFISTLSPTSQLVGSPAPNATFNGILDNNTVIPPDVNGAAGPSQLFETLNSQYRIFSKTGSTVATLSLTSFWSGLSSVGTPYSDPHIVYDSLSGRWYACIIGQLTNGHYGIFLAASLTNNPGGSWYEYSLDAGPSTFLPDYPLLGYNKKWLVITTNDFKNNSFLRSRIVVFNKSKAKAGTLTAVNTFFDSTLFTISPAETMDATQNTEYMLCNYNGNSGGAGYVKICKITGTVSAPVYKRGALIGVNQPWSDATLDAPQNGSIRLINTGGTKMRAIIVRNGFIWATHTVYLPAASPTHSASDFWQIDPVANTVSQYGLIDDPTGALWVSYSSLAVNAKNDVLLGSTMVGSAIYASAVYSYRNHADAASAFRSVYTYKAGLASYYKTYGGTRNRWGDFSATSLDPSDGTFWTLQEFASTPKNTWGTSWANVSAVAFAPAAISNPENISAADDNSLTVNPNPAKGNFTVNYKSAKPGNGVLYIYNMSGMAIYSRKVPLSEGLNHININLTNTLNGNYKVVIQNGTEIKQVQLVISQ